MNRRNKLATLTAIAGLTSGIAVMFTGAAGAVNTSPVTVTNGASNPVPVNGTVNIGNLPATQQVGGTVNIGNLPATQQVGGTVNVGNLPDDQQVHGNVKVDNLPADQQVHGAVDVKDGTAYSAHADHGNAANSAFAMALIRRAGADPVVLDTVGVQVRVPAGAHPDVQIGCGSDSVPIPVVFQWSERDGDHYAGTLTDLNISCGGDDDLFAIADTHPSSDAEDTVEVGLQAYGHIRR